MKQGQAMYTGQELLAMFGSWHAARYETNPDANNSWVAWLDAEGLPRILACQRAIDTQRVADALSRSRITVTALAHMLTKTPEFEQLVTGMLTRGETFTGEQTAREFKEYFGRSMCGAEQVCIELAVRGRKRRERGT